MDRCETSNTDTPNTSDPQKKARRFLSIYWRCCHVYSRIYPNRAATAYEGNCPRCRSFLQVPIGEGGTQQRSFMAE